MSNNMNTSKPMQFKPIDFAKGPVKIRIFNVPVQYRKHYLVKPNCDICSRSCSQSPEKV